MEGLEEYLKRKEKYNHVYSGLTKRYNLISGLRLLLVIIFIFSFYYYSRTTDLFPLVCLILTVIFFLIIIKLHPQLSWEIAITKALLTINNDEIEYLKGEHVPFADGSEFKDVAHAYSFDLDFFGKHSLFQNLNRTATYIGKKKFAGLLLTLLPAEKIKLNQEAISELSGKLDWRQYLLAIAKVNDDNKEIYDKLVNWSETKSETLYKVVLIISYLLPVLFFCSIISYVISKDALFLSITAAIMLMNMIVLSSQHRKIKEEILGADKVYKIINRYGLIIQKIETENFNSIQLKLLKASLTVNGLAASKEIKNLSSLFSRMQSIQNAFGAFLFNSTFLYHIHTLNTLLKWKQEFAVYIPQWLDVIGEIESLNSLANFHYNNPTFTFPTLNNNFKIQLDECGHPLIRKEKRICNSVNFNTHQFIILTGSNMSGKSTFLRTIGINMILAGIGSPVCAVNANVHPIKVLVSMRLNDSLAENESYFFAEVKRLKEIMTNLESKVCFVILDEILKGTNSDDKRTGTIAFLKKIIEKGAIGAIATHDLEICKTRDEYPDKVANNCFEVEIVNNDLAFDYKLRDGVCKNKSATFLMKKMEII